MSEALPSVAACVPAYRSAAFITDTLAALDAQTYPDLQILVSVDPSDDDTAGVCSAFRSRRRVEVAVQPVRRGWVANTNAVLDRVHTDLFFICPHDDIVLPDYVSSLQSLLSARPDAVAAYSDVQTFGQVEEVRRVVGLDANRADRICALMSQRREGVPWRALTRSRVLRDGMRMRDNAHAGFHSHVAWILELLVEGPFLHHPRALYRRHERVDEHSVVRGWVGWTAAQRAAAVKANTLECLGILARAKLDDREWARTAEALLARLHDRWPKAGEGMIPRGQAVEELRDEARRLRSLTSDQAASVAASRLELPSSLG